MKSVSKFTARKKKGPLERSKPPKQMLYMMKNIIFKLLIHVKILNGDSILNDSNHIWNSSLKAFLKESFSHLLGIDRTFHGTPCISVLVINSRIRFQRKCFEWTFSRKPKATKLIATKLIHSGFAHKCLFSYVSTFKVFPEALMVLNSHGNSSIS